MDKLVTYQLDLNHRPAYLCRILMHPFCIHTSEWSFPWHNNSVKLLSNKLLSVKIISHLLIVLSISTYQYLDIRFVTHKPPSRRAPSSIDSKVLTIMNHAIPQYNSPSPSMWSTFYIVQVTLYFICYSCSQCTHICQYERYYMINCHQCTFIIMCKMFHGWYAGSSFQTSWNNIHIIFPHVDDSIYPRVKVYAGVA